MGFFSGISSIASGLGGIMGGPKQSQNVPASGYYSMPPSYQKFYDSLAKAGNSTLLPGGQPNSAMFTPLPQTAEETKGIGLVNQGIAATPESLQRDLAMFMNPFDDYVINDINRQATGENSLVNQFGTLAGQQGSNRNFLATSDVEQNRLNSIGQFRQSQYNNSIDDILGSLTNARQMDIGNLFGVGELQRGIDAGTKQAPYTALAAAGGLLGGMPTNFGGGTQAANVSSGSSAGSTLGKVAQGAQLAATIAGFFSDERLKENIVPAGEENGHNLYEFNYKGDDKRLVGVMAQEVLEKDPDAVFEVDGFYAVNYDRLGIRMRSANV